MTHDKRYAAVLTALAGSLVLLTMAGSKADARTHAVVTKPGPCGAPVVGRQKPQPRRPTPTSTSRPAPTATQKPTQPPRATATASPSTIYIGGTAQPIGGLYTATPTSTPTATAAATATPIPFRTVSATDTLYPTFTPTATPTAPRAATPAPTSTPLPTNTSTSVPTPTAIATVRPRPTLSITLPAGASRIERLGAGVETAGQRTKMTPPGIVCVWTSPAASGHPQTSIPARHAVFLLAAWQVKRDANLGHRRLRIRWDIFRGYQHNLSLVPLPRFHLVFRRALVPAALKPGTYRLVFAPSVTALKPGWYSVVARALLLGRGCPRYGCLGRGIRQTRFHVG